MVEKESETADHDEGDFLDKLQGSMSTREGVKAAAVTMAIFMEEFVTAGFTRSESVEFIKSMMAEQMRAQRKPPGGG